jgi:microsomal dipeptidase-like Zn-dependent dipeptidase
MVQRLILALFVCAAICVAAVLLVTPLDRVLNRVTQAPTLVPEPARALHDSLSIADFHNDALLWNRSLLETGGRGLLDLARMERGGFRLAVFSATTRMHIASNYHRTLPVLDVLAAVAIASHWPRPAWFDPYPRAIALAQKLRTESVTSRGRLRLVRSRTEMATLMRDQTAGNPVVGAVLSLEGMHALDGNIAHVDTLFAAGYRVFGVTHMFDNDIGGSSSGWRKGRLTPFGRRVVARIDSLGGIIDLAHASPATIADVLSITSRPVVVSHTGLTSTCPGPRNLSDEDARRIAERGGVIAIGFWKQAVCGKDTRAIARALRHAIDVVGIEHVALGSDFDGGVAMPFDAAHISLLTAALLDEGLTYEQIRRVMGENELKFLSEMLPAN